MIEINNLVKNYGTKFAVDDISFKVGKGEIVGFLGPNGAGKSTTMNILTGCLAATSGEVKVDGHDIFEDPIEAKKHIGYLPEQPPLYLDMTVEEAMNFFSNIPKIRKKLETIYDVGLGYITLGQSATTLSGGERARVTLAKLILKKVELK